jgi:hypothetical protein
MAMNDIMISTTAMQRFSRVPNQTNVALIFEINDYICAILVPLKKHVKNEVIVVDGKPKRSKKMLYICSSSGLACYPRR